MEGAGNTCHYQGLPHKGLDHSPRGAGSQVGGDHPLDLLISKFRPRVPGLQCEKPHFIQGHTSVGPRASRGL